MLLGLLLPAAAGNAEAATSTGPSGPIATIEALRLRGALYEADAAAREALANAAGDPDLQVELYLEMAKILDRFGLHRNTRPVAESLAAVHAAAAVHSQPSVGTRGAIELAKTDYYYRAELAGREFPTALRHAEEAIRLLTEAGDARRLADAVHRLGLIRMQRRELDEAHQLFDRSLEIDAEAGAREHFLGEYHRHVGFVHWLREDIPKSVPHFRKSLEYRRRAGAIDASLFAAISLGSALVETGAVEEAREHLLYALTVADQLDSPAGRARTAIALGAMYEALDDSVGARVAYDLCVDTATAIGMQALADRAGEALERIKAQAD